MNIMIIVTAYFFMTKPAGVLIGRLLKKWQIDIPSNSALTNGGRIIGYLERILILTFVLVGEFTGVGFVLAAKSIFRFSEVSGDSISRTEYFIIGTFLSVATSLITGVTVNYLVH